MNRLVPALVAIILGACAVTMGGGRDVPATVVALRSDADPAPADVAGALQRADASAAFLVGPGDEAWFRGVADATGYHLVGPATMGDLGMAFVGPEPVGDTIHTISYEGGRLVVLDALYEMSGRRLLDLLAFRVDESTDMRAATVALLEYVATDVGNSAALVMAVVVPDAAVGDRLARALSPGYYEASQCAADDAGPSTGPGIRMFYGPEARVYCTDANVENATIGGWIRADLVLGRR